MAEARGHHCPGEAVEANRGETSEEEQDGGPPATAACAGHPAAGELVQRRGPGKEGAAKARVAMRHLPQRRRRPPVEARRMCSTPGAAAASAVGTRGGR